MHNQAFVIFKLGKHEDGERAFKRCIEYAEAQGDLSTSGFAHSNLAHIYLEMGNIEKSEEELAKAGHLIARTNDRYGLNLIRWVKGLIFAQKGDLEEAINHYKSAMKHYDDMNLPGQKLHITVDYIPVFLKAGRREELIRLVKGLRVEFKKNGFDHLLMRVKEAEKELLEG
jgi:tetratricopeptide (TPR) repeat protein